MEIQTCSWYLGWWFKNQQAEQFWGISCEVRKSSSWVLSTFPSVIFCPQIYIYIYMCVWIFLYYIYIYLWIFIFTICIYFLDMILQCLISIELHGATHTHTHTNVFLASPSMLFSMHGWGEGILPKSPWSLLVVNQGKWFSNFHLRRYQNRVVLSIFFFHPEPWGFMIQFDEHNIEMGGPTTN